MVYFFVALRHWQPIQQATDFATVENEPGVTPYKDKETS